jgi:hypothetical protein
METLENRSERFESKAQRTQQTRHAEWVGEERAPRNTDLELGSRFYGVSKCLF